MDRATLIRAMDNVNISDEECAAFNAAMIQAGCTNENRAAMWCAQIGHESVGLRYYEEIASGDDYEWRDDLGNVHPGDGRRYKGRGPIQVTGRHNYTVLSQWAYEHGYVPTVDYFVAAPDQLGTIGFGFLGAVWYWTTQRRLNELSDARDIYGATRAINGGLNGIDNRLNRYNRCLSIGEALLPDEGDGFVANEAQAVATQMVGPDGRGFEALLGKAVETDPNRGRYLTEAIAVLLVQLCGDPNFGGWEQLGGRTVVDALAAILDHLGIEAKDGGK